MSKRRKNSRKKSRSELPRRLFPKRSKSAPANQSNVAIFHEYYQIPFYMIMEEVSRRCLYHQGYSDARRTFWSQIPPRVYDPEEGHMLLDSYVETIQAELARSISTQSIAYWLHVFRRLAPKAIGRNKSPATISLTRAALEAAIQKWGSFSFCDRVASSDSVDESAILKGRLVSLKDRATIEALRKQPQLVLTNFDRDEYIGALETEKLAYEIWRSMAMRRILGKGCDLVVGDHDEIVRDDRSDELDKLVRIFDKRTQLPFVTATGTVFANAFREQASGAVLFPRYNVYNISFTQTISMFQHFLKFPVDSVDPSAGPNFIWMPFNLAAYREAHHVFAEAFVKKHSLTLDSVIGVLAGMAYLVMLSWIERPHFFFIRHWQRAYDGPQNLEKYMTLIQSNLSDALGSTDLKIKPEAVDVRAAVNFLTLREEDRAGIGISYSGPHYVFLPCGQGRYFIDYAHIIDRLYLLFFGLNPSDQKFKGTALEIMTRGGCSALPHEELKAEDDSRKQIDAAFDLGEILVIAECKAKSRSIAFDRGDPTAIDMRRDLVEQALNESDEKAHWLSAHRKGTKYDITNYKYILPVGVTPFKEFIPSLSPRYWITETLPRVLTPDELRDAITKGTIKQAAITNPNTIRLS